MDTVKFEIALSRNHPNKVRNTPSPTASSSTSAIVPHLPSDSETTGTATPVPETPTKLNNSLSRDMVAGPLFSSNKIESPKMEKKDLGDRFHDWMEMDLEHGL